MGLLDQDAFMSELAKLHDKRYVSQSAGTLVCPLMKQPSGRQPRGAFGGMVSFYSCGADVLTPAHSSSPQFFVLRTRMVWAPDGVSFVPPLSIFCRMCRVCVCGRHAGRPQQAERLGVDFNEARLPGRADGQEAADCTYGPAAAWEWGE